jgi:heterodisulfide reductase subunit A-like polyferredoxin
VTVFEKLPVPGGMLTVGIPSYRLPKNIIEAEIQVIRDMGVEFKTGVEIGKDFTISQLRDQGYKAFFMGIGAQECKALSIPGEELEGVVPGVEYLRDINLGKKVPLGDRVAVIGGGNVAMDTVRTALRNGSSKPFIVYRRSEKEMPANEEEIHECSEEGIEIMTLTNPKRVIGENGRVKAVECERMELGEPDASGRRRPVAIAGSEFIMEVDAVVPAIGQESDWACLTEECACRLTDWGTMTIDPLTQQTHDPDIFAGGDAVTGPKTVIKAIAAGKQAAISIGRYIRGEDLSAGREKEWQAVREVSTEGYDRMPRARMPVVSPEVRTGNFEEVQLGFTEEQVRAEAARCLSCGVCSECYQCVEACLANAVCHEAQPRPIELNVGAIIAAPGFRAFDPSKLDTHGYGKFPNVVTSMEFERILSPSGPTQGHLVRPSDHQEPKKIAWIQCVGSRDRQHGAHTYCSGVCCMYAIKESMVAKEHCPEGLDTAIFYMDMRTYGKDFEKYYNRARDKHGVRFIRSRVHTVDPVPGSDNVSIQYTNEAGEQLAEQFDMIVLSVGVETTPETVELAKRLGIDVTDHNFAQTGGFAPVSASRPGMYVCGLFQGPKDIPSSVMEASAAACAAAIDLAPARGSQVKIREVPPEKDFSEQEPRIGVFICNCGINIASVVDVKEVTRYAATLPNVVYSTDYLFTCSQDSQEKVKEIIKENGLNRVVVAACSPRTHEPLFQETMKDSGLNKYLFEMANIRDQDAWVHQKEPVLATEKAKDLIRMSVARASLLKPLVEKSLTVNPRALIVGGGIAGMTAALGLARQGFETIIVEKNAELGGMARNIPHTIEGLNVSEYLEKLTAQIRENAKIEVLTGARLTGVSGYKGNFVSKIENGAGGPREVSHGVIIVATGAHEYKPKEFLYGESDRVITQVELGQLVKNNPGEVSKWGRAIMIQCVGSRNDENPNCSRICCQGAVKHALELKQLNPEMDVVVLYRDMRTYGVLEDYYTKARQNGVLFVRFDKNSPPEVAQDSKWPLSVSFMDHVLQRPVQMSADAVILSAATLPEENDELAGLLKVPRNPEGFFIEAHVKLRPVDFASEGIYLCGTAHSPKLISESIAQAMAAAARAASFLSAKEVTVGGVVAEVEPRLCAACLVCVRSCPYGVPRINESDVSEINEALCQGCGVCVSECPAKAIRLGHYTDDQIMIKVDALLEGAI